jgi:glycosyltransferase A (GT-A) superfamily protein (DUF2064 family)
MQCERLKNRSSGEIDGGKYLMSRRKFLPHFCSQVGKSAAKLQQETLEIYRDLSWVHPDYEQEFQQSLKSQQNLVV